MACAPGIAKSVVDALKTGDRAKYYEMLHMHNIQPREVIDANNFNQNLLFSATALRDEDSAIELCTELIKKGADPGVIDNLKQTPLYYASRDGGLKIAKFLIDQGLNPSHIDTYG